MMDIYRWEQNALMDKLQEHIDKEMMPDKILVNEIKVTLEQGPDDCGPAEDQILIVSMCDAGAGHYFVIETDRWAFDNIKDLIDKLEVIKKAFDLL